MSLENKNKKTQDELKKNNPKGQDTKKPMGNIESQPNQNALNADDSKVQNPNRSLAQGGNNTPYNKK